MEEENYVIHLDESVINQIVEALDYSSEVDYEEE